MFSRSPSGLAGEDTQSPCTPDSQKAASRNLARLPLAPPALSHFEAKNGAPSLFLYFPSIPDFSLDRPGEGEGGKGNITGETKLRPARGRRQTGIGARRPCSTLSIGAMASEGQGTERVRAKLGRYKSLQNSARRPPPPHSP